MERRTFIKLVGVSAATALPAEIAASAAGATTPARAAGANAPIMAIEHHATGLLLRMADGVMGLDVWSDGVVRVRYAPGKFLPRNPSLAVVHGPAAAKWGWRQTRTHIILTTKLLQAHVSRATGAMAFISADGTPLLAEPSAGGKQMTAAIVEREQTFLPRQTFLLNQNEAIYGLGQHQQGVMNYRGHWVFLQQRNRHVAIPFFVSSHGYGVLWDNPAETTVAVDVPVYSIIPRANLLAPDGQTHGLQAQYFSGKNFNAVKHTAITSTVDFNWAGAPAPGVGHNNFSARFSGFLTAADTGEYLLQTVSDDGVRLWLDGKLVIDDWQVQPAATRTARVHLTAGKKVPLRIEYFQATRQAVLQLSWAKTQPIPAMSLMSNAGAQIDYYFMAGPQMDSVLRRYRELTGAAPMFPRWAWGYWQSKEHYNSQAEIVGVVRRYRKIGVPLDGIIQDWLYWAPHPWGSHEFDRKRYPHPKQMVEQIHGMHAHIIISVWARFQPGSANYRQLLDAKVLLPMTGGMRYYDPFNPLGRKLYWQQMRKELFSLGMDGWWLDASEPELTANWGQFAPMTTADGPGAFVYNAYPLMHTGAVYRGQRVTPSAKRVFILTRSAYAGQQRHAAVTWSGDTQGNWETFRRQIPAGINFCLSGIPYWNTDIGGFFSHNPKKPAYAELFTRWFQFGAFCPMFRVHGTNFPKEVWRFAPHIQKILIAYIHLRYRLLPYIYSVAWNVTHQHYTMLRGLVMDFRDDPAVRDIPDQFMFGPALLVNPVTRPGIKTRPTYLPAADWIDFYTGAAQTGGRKVDLPCPLESMPLLVRAGSIIPLGPLMQYATEKPADPIELRIYPGRNCQFNLYEDENDNYNYQWGDHATIPIFWHDKARTLTIGARQGAFPGMLRGRTFNVVLVHTGHGAGTQPEPHPDHVVSYTGDAVTLRLG